MPATALFGGRLLIITDLFFVLFFFLCLPFIDAIGFSSVVESANPGIFIKQQRFLPRVIVDMGKGIFCGSFNI